MKKEIEISIRIGEGLFYTTTMVVDRQISSEEDALNALSEAVSNLLNDIPLEDVRKELRGVNVYDKKSLN